MRSGPELQVTVPSCKPVAPIQTPTRTKALQKLPNPPNFSTGNTTSKEQFAAQCGTLLLNYHEALRYPPLCAVFRRHRRFLPDSLFPAPRTAHRQQEKRCAASSSALYATNSAGLENDLFLDRWQQNFGSRLTKPAAAPILTIPTDIRPAPPAAIPGILSDILNPAQKPASLSAPPDFDPGKLYAIPLDTLQPPPHRTVMHGALDFLKPAAALPAEPAKDWRDWVPLSDSSARVGAAVPEAAKRVFSAPMPAGLFGKKPEPRPPAFVMPANTVTKAELVRQIVAQAPPPGACPGCGGDVYEGDDGMVLSFLSLVLLLMGCRLEEQVCGVG